MRLESLNCPTCGAPCLEETQPGQPFHCTACGSILILTDLVEADQVECTACQAVNSESQRFCTRCGAPLKTACPVCYAENQVDTVHCARCGVDLQKAWQRKRAWLMEKRQYDQERAMAIRQAETEARQAELQRLVHDLDEPQNHPMAIYCLHRIGTRAVEPLVAALSSVDPDARVGAARALGKIGDARAIPALTEVLADVEPAVRYWAADALGQLKADGAVQAIAQLLDDKHAGVRDHAAEVLQQIGGPQAEAALKLRRHRLL